ncbi:MAG TPA: signal peptidase II [Deltaproteobacteria bacterium]|nr:signal peptidase II [Deltaproteobacteria bacterium]HPJ94396.1 signal peptidase II [Deltaproteobacteria bacterium]HPR52175.1 signal peptidase II [Deltaproteobacteria bacterium]
MKLGGKTGAGRSLASILKWGMLLVLPLYALDQWTKRLICEQVDIGTGFTVIPGFFDIIHMRNTGAAFSLLQNIPAAYRTYFFLSVTIVALVAIFTIFWKSSGSSWQLKTVMSFIIAGAIGNLTDRILFNEVVDFLSFYLGHYRWPTFNLADTYISLGMVGLIIHTFFTSKRT